MEDSLFWGIPRSAYESADRMLTLAKKSRIRQHLLGDTSGSGMARSRIRAWMNTAIFYRQSFAVRF